jgi:hypothetical protein
MVEFAVAILAALPSTSSASESNPRVDANQLLDTKSSDPAKARVMVHRLLYKTADENLNIISNRIVADYNSAYSATSYILTVLKANTFTALETKTLVSVPDKVGFTPSFWSGCRWCPTDDALTDPNAVAGHATNSFEVVADIHMPNDGDSALIINDTTTVLSRFASSFWPGCRWFPNDDAIAFNESPILEDSHIALKHQGFESSRISASPALPTSRTDLSAASTAPSEVSRRPRSRVDGGWGLRTVHCAHGR